MASHPKTKEPYKGRRCKYEHCGQYFIGRNGQFYCRTRCSLAQNRLNKKRARLAEDEIALEQAMRGT